MCYQWEDKMDSPIGWGSCRLLQHFPILDLVPDLCAGPTHLLSWIHLQDKPPSSGDTRPGWPATWCIATNSQNPLASPSIAVLSDLPLLQHKRQDLSWFRTRIIITTIVTGCNVTMKVHELQSFDNRKCYYASMKSMM